MHRRVGTHLEDLLHGISAFDVEDKLGFVEGHAMLSGELVGGGRRGGVADASYVAAHCSLGRCGGIWRRRVRKGWQREGTTDF